MTKTALVVVTKPNTVISLLPKIKSYIKKTLYVLLLSEQKLYNNIEKNNFSTKRLSSASNHSSSVVRLYSDTLSSNLDVRVLLSGLRGITDIYTRNSIEVIYFDKVFNSAELKSFVTDHVKTKISNCEVVSINEHEENNSNSLNAASKLCNYECSQPDSSFNQVVLGGTFDRLHAGHKILLSEAILHCTKKLTVGVTDTAMLKTKTLWELIEPCPERMQNVKDFLQEVEPRLEYNVVPISDAYGPTKDVPEFEMIVVSAETVKGGDKVNEVRKGNNLKPLFIHSVPLVPEDNKADEIEEDKISSSNGRLRLLGTLLRPPTPKPQLPASPYIIGLSGGIASGKSSIAERLARYGATVINADKMGHKAYDVDTPCYNAVVKHFGSSIVNDDRTINRTSLGAIVFNNKAQLVKLNEIVWPSLLGTIKEDIDTLRNTGSKIVVIEAAVLYQAKWYTECHEVWTSIVPEEEAVERLQNRNNLSAEEALSRIKSQPSNSEQLEISNVVFCTLWSPSYTSKQVLRAWDELQGRLSFKIE